MALNNSFGFQGMYGQGLTNPNHYLQDMGEDTGDEPENANRQGADSSEFERIRRENAELRRKLEDQAMHSTQKINELSSQMNNLQARYAQTVTQPPAPQAPTQEVKDLKTADEFLSFWQNQSQTQSQPENKKQQQPPQQTQQAPPQVDIKPQLDSYFADQQRQQQAIIEAETMLVERFRRDYPEVASNYPTEVVREWNKLKALRPDMPPEKRYELLEEEIKVRFSKNSGSRPSNISIPVSGAQRSQTTSAWDTATMTEQQLIHAKNQETARAVAARMKDQNMRAAMVARA